MSGIIIIACVVALSVFVVFLGMVVVAADEVGAGAGAGVVVAVVVVVVAVTDRGLMSSLTSLVWAWTMLGSAPEVKELREDSDSQGRRRESGRLC